MIYQRCSPNAVRSNRPRGLRPSVGAEHLWTWEMEVLAVSDAVIAVQQLGGTTVREVRTLGQSDGQALT
jgi:hypothetical protein